MIFSEESGASVPAATRCTTGPRCRISQGSAVTSSCEAAFVCPTHIGVSAQGPVVPSEEVVMRSEDTRGESMGKQKHPSPRSEAKTPFDLLLVDFIILAESLINTHSHLLFLIFVSIDLAPG